MPALPNTTPVPGATWRYLDPDQDAAAYAALFEAARAADGGVEVTTVEIAQHELTDPTSPAATNVIGLSMSDGTLLGVARVVERREGIAALRAYTWGTTHPAWRGRGIGTELASWAVGRAREVLASFEGDLPRYIETFLDAPLQDARAVYEALGLHPVRWYVDMQRDLAAPIPATPALDGVRIVPWSQKDSEAVRATHNESFADHWGSEPIPAEGWDRDVVGAPGFRPDLSFVAVDGAELVGYSLASVSPADWAVTGVRDGWVTILGVRRPWRKHGVATGLLVAALSAYRDAGLEAATLGVDTENPTGAVGLYERLGFRPIRRFVRLRAAVEDLASLSVPAAAR